MGPTNAHLTSSLIVGGFIGALTAAAYVSGCALINELSHLGPPPDNRREYAGAYLWVAPLYILSGVILGWRGGLGREIQLALPLLFASFLLALSLRWASQRLESREAD